jgi:hypothetical protein
MRKCSKPVTPSGSGRSGGLIQGAVWPVHVAEVLVLAQDGHQMTLVPGR